MNTKRTIPTDFGPETRFDVPTPPPVPFRGGPENDLERLKAHLLRQALTNHAAPEFNAPLRHAANEATALVWWTPYPLLLLPELFAEKARMVVAQTRRQLHLNARRRDFTAEVA